MKKHLLAIFGMKISKIATRKYKNKKNHNPWFFLLRKIPIVKMSNTLKIREF